MAGGFEVLEDLMSHNLDFGNYEDNWSSFSMFYKYQRNFKKELTYLLLGLMELS